MDQIVNHEVPTARILPQSVGGGLRTTVPKPVDFEPPAYNTPAYWRACAQGWICEQQQQADHADYESRRQRALNSKHNRVAPPHRHERAAPTASKQYSKAMSTEAARDDRLTPQSKALLQVFLARCGKGRFTDTTKTTLGVMMNRSPRSIQRYVQELVKFGYIRTQVRKSKRTGFYIGLRIWVMNRVLPYFHRHDTAYEPSHWPDFVTSRRNRVETKESLTKVSNNIVGVLKQEKPPWFRECCFA